MLKTTEFRTGQNTRICLHCVMYVILSIWLPLFCPTLTALKGPHGMYFTYISVPELPVK